jgi:hypothetical protein
MYFRLKTKTATVTFVSNEWYQKDSLSKCSNKTFGEPERERERSDSLF